MKTYVRVWHYVAEVYLEGEILQANCVDIFSPSAATRSYELSWFPFWLLQ